MATDESRSGFGSWGHLALRFFGALLPVGPRPSRQRWALGQLSTEEARLFSAMSGPDRRHAIGVARSAQGLAAADGRATRDLPAGFVAAALLHDVGKIESGLGTLGRVGATLAARAVGRDRIVSPARPRPGRRPAGRVASYLGHDQIGARLLEGAGSDGLAVGWAREHHLPEHRWSIERQVGRYLKAADGD
ncbi:MAG: hypothetical protein ACRDY0_00260 [Acidimicrobiales bacterium]